MDKGDPLGLLILYKLLHTTNTVNASEATVNASEATVNASEATVNASKFSRQPRTQTLL